VRPGLAGCLAQPIFRSSLGESSVSVPDFAARIYILRSWVASPHRALVLNAPGVKIVERRRSSRVFFILNIAGPHSWRDDLHGRAVRIRLLRNCGRLFSPTPLDTGKVRRSSSDSVGFNENNGLRILSTTDQICT